MKIKSRQSTTAIVFLLLLLACGVPKQSTATYSRSTGALLPPPGWAIERIQSFKDFDQLSTRHMALDAGGYAHTAYGGDHLYYARQDASGWHITTVDPRWDVGSGAALALDQQGRVHISYCDRAGQSVFYATNPEADRWVTIPVAPLNSRQCSTAIVLDSLQNPHIVYSDGAGYLIYTFMQSDGSWAIPVEIAETGSNPSGYLAFSFALSADDIPHLSFARYLTEAQSAIVYTWRNASTWAQVVIADPLSFDCSNADCRFGLGNSLALDSQGNVHIAWSDPLHGEIREFYFDGSEYQSGTIFQQTILSALEYLSLFIDSSDQRHLLFTEADTLNYTKWDGSWDLPLVFDEYDQFRYPSLAVNADQHVSLTYYAPASYKLQYIKYNGTIFVARQAIDSAGPGVGVYSAIEIDPTDRLHIASYVSDWNRLQFQYGLPGDWQIEQLSSDNSTQGVVSLALDADDIPGAAFENETGALHARVRSSPPPDDGVWSYLADPVEIDLGEDLLQARSPALAFALDGTALLAYIKGSDLIFARYHPVSGWTKTVVDSGSNMRGLKMLLTPEDQVHLVYLEEGQLWHALYNAVSWSTQIVVKKGLLSHVYDLALGSSGELHLAYMADDLQNLMYTRRVCQTTCTWSNPVVIDAAAERFVAMAVDRLDILHVIYQYTNDLTLESGLGYARRVGGTWVVQQLLPGALNEQADIALDSANKPYITFYDTQLGDLMLAHFSAEQVYLPLVLR